jgi:molybdopterin molybdotransferase
VVAELPSIEEALELILGRARRLPTELVGVGEASGRVAASPIRAAVDLPPFPSSAMDGFAVRVADTPGRLPVGFRIAAGRPPMRPLDVGEAMAIATGGVVPEGADAVVPIEYVVDNDNEVEIREQVVAGASIRARGGDVRAGEEVVPAGTLFGPAHLAATAAVGVAEVECARRPRAAVLVTGTELQQPGRPLAPGQVYEANGVMLAAQLASAGATVDSLAAVEDDETAHRAALERGLEGDVLVTSGGVSVGPHDLVRSVERELGVEEVFWRVAVKPGKPISFGVRGATLVFGLPGNPVSALVGFELFVRPALLALQGAVDPRPPFLAGLLSRKVNRNPHRDELVRARSARRDGEIELDPVTGQESHMIVRAAAADALVLVRRGEGALGAGTRVDYLRLRY